LVVLGQKKKEKSQNLIRRGGKKDNGADRSQRKKTVPILVKKTLLSPSEKKRGKEPIWKMKEESGIAPLL